jgi:hypothetical protein
MNSGILENGGPNRISHFIKRLPAVNLHHAVRFSRRIDLPLNRFITINFSHTGCPSNRASHVFRKLLTQRFAPWLRRSANLYDPIPPTYVWVLECCRGQAAVHWLVHVPKRVQRDFDAKIERWVESLLDEPPLPGVVRVKPITNLTGLKWYILKGVDPVWAQHLGVRPIDQGRTVGKRSGFSKNLGPMARKNGGYKPRRMPPRGM